MNKRAVSFPEHLSSRELLDALPLLVRRESEAIAELVAHIAVVDARRLYRDEAFPSMHQYCVDKLHLAEGAAYKRITAARAARRFPVILAMLADGRLHLSAVCLLSQHLTLDNHSSLLLAAVHKSKRGIEMLLAECFPKPDVPPSMRKLPTLPPAPQPPPQTPLPSPAAAPPAGPVPTPTRASPPSPPPRPPVAPAPAPRPAVVAPLSAERFKLQLTISRQTRDRLEEARDLLAHQVPSGDLAAVVDRALELLVRELRKKKFAETLAPREPKPTGEGDHSRHIPNHVKRAVAERDGHQCTFVAEDGRRCPARRRLELHHIDPEGKGGEPTVSNVTLRCRSHNVQAAEQDYGAGHVAQRIALARARRRGRGTQTPSPGTVPASAASVPGLFDAIQPTLDGS